MSIKSLGPISPGQLEKYLHNTQLLQQIFQDLPEMIQIIDAKTIKPLYTNKSLLHLLGYDHSQITQLSDKWPQHVIHPDDMPLLTNHLKHLVDLEIGEESRIVYGAKGADGYWRRIESINRALTKDDEGETEKVIGFTRDITKSLIKSNVPEEVLEHRCRNCRKLLGIENIVTAKIDVKCLRCGEINLVSHSSLDAIFNDIHGRVCITDTEYKILYVNKFAVEMTGYSISELLGKTPKIWGRFMPEEFYEDVHHRLFKNKSPILVHLKNQKKSGEIYDAKLRLSPVLDPQGEIVFIIGIEKNDK